MPRVLLKIVAATVVATLVLMTVADYLREMLPGRFHEALWLTGVILFCSCVLIAAFAQGSGAGNQRRLENVLLTGVVMGALLFLLFISDMECSTRSSAHGGTFSCRYTGEFYK